MLVPDANMKILRMLVTKMAKTVTNIFKLSPTHFVTNIDITEMMLIFFSVSDYKYDDESDYGNGMYTPTFDTGSSSSHLDHDQGKPKPYLNFINSV